MNQAMKKAAKMVAGGEVNSNPEAPVKVKEDAGKASTAEKALTRRRGPRKKKEVVKQSDVPAAPISSRMAKQDSQDL